MAPAPPRAAVIVNPISGTGHREEQARRRVEAARAAIARRRLDVDLEVTEHAGHAAALARAALARGASPIVAWGGDGTINEVASQLVFQYASLGIVPSGSGNGLARGLAIPFDPDAAFDVAFDGQDRLIDAGEIDGRLFFNIAGIGLDANVARRFAVDGLVRRGFRRYATLAARELLAFQPTGHVLVADGLRMDTRAMVIAVANGRQYGSGALIAPGARFDDGLLDLVVVEHRPLLHAVVRVPWLFAGRIDRVPGVMTRRIEQIEIVSPGPVAYHVDGEPFVGGVSLRATVRRAALRVRVPRERYGSTNR